MTEKLGNPTIAKIYQDLGPFNYHVFNKFEIPDFWLANEKRDEAKKLADEREMLEEYVQRKSGAQYRGETLWSTQKPDGRGIKIFQG